MSIVLKIHKISKKFGSLIANDAVSLKLEKGEILALLGENGAGKTTLMNIIYGHYTSDSGNIEVLGKRLSGGRPREAIEAGIGMVHQHFSLAGNLTVLENVMIGSEPLFKRKTNRQLARKKLLQISKKFGLPVSPDAQISSLSVGERQRVEILKALYRDAQILILDEPTAVLARPEAEKLFKTLREMTKEGLSLIFISHKLHEVMSAADRVTVLRSGRVVAERDASKTSKEELAELMVGHQVSRPVRQAQRIGKKVIEASNITVKYKKQIELDRISFSISEGEILGIVGVSGNGQAALGRLLSGIGEPTSGTLSFYENHMNNYSPRDCINSGIGRIPEDRNSEGIIGELKIWENAIIERLHESKFAKAGFIRKKSAQIFTEKLIEKFDVRGATPETQARLLSGGNMQKLVLGRALSVSPKLIIANQPTRGLDEGAIAAVHKELLKARGQGVAILLISEELDEAVGLSDRLQAIVKGKLSKPIKAEDADAKRLGLMMSGVWGEENET
jgi:simple sugar transport system ATP-binding protein